MKRDTRRRHKHQTGTQPPQLNPPPPPPANVLSSCFCGSHWREAAWKKESSQLGGERWEDFFHFCLSDGDRQIFFSHRAIHPEVRRLMHAVFSDERHRRAKVKLEINCIKSVTLLATSDGVFQHFVLFLSSILVMCCICCKCSYLLT